MRKGPAGTGACCSEMWIAGAPLRPWIHPSPHHAEKMMVRSSKRSVISSAAIMVSNVLFSLSEHGGAIQTIHSMAHHTLHATKRMVLKNLGKDLRGVFKQKCECIFM
jgi:hypothetical protein